MLIGFWLLAAGPDADLVSLELVGVLLVCATGAVVWVGWQARRRVGAAALAAPAFGETLLPFASLAAVGGVDDDAAETAPPADAVGVDEAGLRAIALAAFVRLQTAWDGADRAVLAAMTTRAMFAELEPVLDARVAGAAQRTEVMTLEAKVVAAECAGDAAVATVLFSGLIRDQADAGAEPFRELWMLERDGGAGAGWKLAGQQTLF